MIRFDARTILSHGADRVVSERLGHSAPLIAWSVYQLVVKVQTDAADVASLISVASS